MADEEKTQNPKPKVQSEGPREEAKATAERPHVVVFKDVTKSFGEGHNAKVAIENVNFTVEDLPNIGELITIVGPSGCGKSTLLRIIAGLKPHFPPTKGEVLVFGKPVDQPGPDRGLVDQKYSLLPHLNVVDNIAFGLRLRGMARAEREQRAMDWVKKVGLEGSETKYPAELSGGMQQRVALAATVILEPRILLMDEPFGALDPHIRLRMQELLMQLWKEQQGTVFLVTHDLDTLFAICDRVAVLVDQTIRIGTLAQHLEDDHPWIHAYFHGPRGRAAQPATRS